MDLNDKLDNLFVIGINHTTASIDLRDQVFFNAEETKQKSLEWIKKNHCTEILILSTCNRTEIYIQTSIHQIDKITEEWRLYKKVTKDLFYEHLYKHQDIEAIKHLFKVCSSLDSMILGENQILGQVKNAYHNAKQNNTVQNIFNQLFQKSLFVGKKIRSNTNIGKGTLSIASVAIDLIKKVDGSQIFKKKIAIIGVGEISNIMCKHLQQIGCTSFDFYNRTLENAQKFIERFRGRAFPLKDLSTKINTYDIIISATSSSNFIITQDQFQRYFFNKNLVLLIDIAAPRDIDPRCAQVSNVLLFSIDDLKQIILQNKHSRKEEATKALSLLEKEAYFLQENLQLTSIKELIQNIQKNFNSSIESTLTKLKNQHSLQKYQQLEKQIRTLGNKEKYQSIETIKNNSFSSSKQELIHMTNSHQHLFLQQLKSFQ